MIRLSAVIITYNEEKNISRCLQSLKGIADEIVIVDSGSDDRTLEIAKEFSAKIVTHPFTGYIEQKNFAVTQTSNEYILSLDADEELSPELHRSIKYLKENWKHDGYSFNRLTNYCGKWIHHCGWYPDPKLRLFRTGTGKWGGSNPHDRFIPDSSSSKGKIKGDLYHYSYYSVEDHIRQADNFSRIEARSAFKNGERSNLYHIIIKPKIKFFRDFILRLGFLDGYYGLVICRISSHAMFLKYVRLHELQKKNLG
jgi:glycosyltransferase involved in cell wall biosynthesis